MSAYLRALYIRRTRKAHICGYCGGAISVCGQAWRVLFTEKKNYYMHRECHSDWSGILERTGTHTALTSTSSE